MGCEIATDTVLGHNSEPDANIHLPASSEPSCGAACPYLSEVRMTAALWLLLWLLSPQEPGVVTGVVVRAGTSQPLNGETVGLWPTNRTVKTRSNPPGMFEFRGVGAGEYSIVVVHDGIKKQVPFVLTGAHRSETVNVEVPPAPAISGTVFDPNGERMAAVHVQAFRSVYTPHGPRVRSVLSVLSDDLGDFRLYWLRPGQYYVSASYNDRDQKIATKGLRLAANVSKPDDGLPTIYYAGAASLAESQRVELTKGGDVDGVSLYVRDGPRFTITGELVSPAGAACARVAVVAVGGFVTDSDFVTDACGSFKLRGLSPGIYAILAVGEMLASDVVRVSVVDRDRDDVKVTLSDTASISGRVPDFPPRGSRVRLSRRSTDISQELETVLESNGSFTFPSVGAGNYDVFLDPLPDKTYISSIRYPARETLNTPIRVDSGGRTSLNIQLFRSDVEAAGVVVDRSLRPVPGAQIVLVPATPHPRADRYLTSVADAGGNFRITGIPGDVRNYLILAFEEIGPDAHYAFFYDPSLLMQYASSGQSLGALNPGTPMRVFAIPASETVGGLR